MLAPPPTEGLPHLCPSKHPVCLGIRQCTHRAGDRELTAAAHLPKQGGRYCSTLPDRAAALRCQEEPHTRWKLSQSCGALTWTRIPELPVYAGIWGKGCCQEPFTLPQWDPVICQEGANSSSPGQAGGDPRTEQPCACLPSLPKFSTFYATSRYTWASSIYWRIPRYPATAKAGVCI